MNLLPFNRNEKVKHEVMFVENGKVSFAPVHSIANGNIESDYTMLREEDAQIYYKVDDGGCLFVYHLDLPAKVEAQNLKQLRRSVVMSKLFDFDREKGVNWISLLPWLIMILLIVFK